MYLGTNAGGVHALGEDYRGDAGEPIMAYWQSRNTDMSDQNPGVAMLFKTVESVKLFYVDKNATDVVVSVSNDDGVTWTDVTKNIGSGSNEPQEATFWFWITGKEFRFKIAHSSSTDDFQWVRAEVNYVSQGEWM